MKCKYITFLSPFGPSHLPSLKPRSCPPPMLISLFSLISMVNHNLTKNCTNFFLFQSPISIIWLDICYSWEWRQRLRLSGEDCSVCIPVTRRHWPGFKGRWFSKLFLPHLLEYASYSPQHHLSSIIMSMFLLTLWKHLKYYFNFCHCACPISYLIYPI